MQNSINSELLQLISSGNIDENTVADIKIMLTRKKIEELHTQHYSIMYNPKRDAWYTCNPEDYKKKIQRHTKNDLLDALMPYYLSTTLTLQGLFEEWLAYKTTITDSPNTITAHRKHWRKYFDGTELFQKLLQDITLKDLNSWANQLIKQYNLSSHQWQTIKTTPKQMFEYAQSKGYITINPFPQIKITVKFRQIKRKSGTTEVYNTDEYDELIEELWNSYEQKRQPRFLAAICNLYMGLRAGELCGLQWKDLDLSARQIHINREIVCMDATQLKNPIYTPYKDSGQIVILPGQGDKKWVYVLLDHTKTHLERKIDLIPKAMEIFQILETAAPNHKPEDYIFAEGTQYLTLRSFNYVLEHACKRIGIDPKRSHKLRKTYASRLNTAGLPLDQIRANLGHTNSSTTLGYIYNPLTPKESLEIMEKAF